MDASVSLRLELASSRRDQEGSFKSQAASFSQYLDRRKSKGESRENAEKPSRGNSTCRMRTLIERIQSLSCPYLEGMEDEVVREVIFSPGEARTRVLTWLTARIHPSLATLVSPDGSSTISTIPRLALLLGDAGLCVLEDHELIKGTTLFSKQLLFLEAIVSVAAMAPWQQDMNLSLADKMQSVPWQMERCCHFVDELSRHNQLSDVFPASVSLVPPGIAMMADRGCVSSHDPQGLPPPPSLSELSSRCDQVRTLLEEKQLELENIRKTHTYAELHPDALESCHKMMAVSLGTLAQLTASFCHSYEAEIQPWTNRETPHLSGLGPLCRRVDHLKQNLDKLFHALGILERSFQQLNELKTSSLTDNRDHLSLAAYGALKDCLAVLKDVH